MLGLLFLPWLKHHQSHSHILNNKILLMRYFYMGYSTEVNSNCDTYISGQTSIFKTKYEKNKLPETRLFMRFLCQICATSFSFLTTSLWASASLTGSRLQMHQQPRTPNNRAQSSNMFPNCFSQILLYANILKN